MSFAQGQDWEQAGWGYKRPQGKQNTAASLNKAKREGNVVTEARSTQIVCPLKSVCN